MADSLSVITLKKAKKYTDESVEGGGAVKGAACQVTDTTRRGTKGGKNGTYIDLKWELNDGTVKTGACFVPDGADGRGIKSVTLPDPTKSELLITFSDDTTTRLTIPTIKGDDGFTPTITVKTSTADTYILHITNADGSFDTPNLKGSGGGGGSTTKKVITASIDVGGITKNTSFPVGTDYDTLWDALLDKTLYPTFTAPSATLSYSVDSYVAVGSTISSNTATLSYNAGAITLDGVKQNDRGGAATGYAIATTGADTEYSDSSEETGVFDVPALTRATKGTIKLTGTVSYAQGAQPKDSKGNDYGSPLSAGSVTAEKVISFVQPYYYGVSNTSTVSDFTGLSTNVSPKGNKTFSYTTDNQHMVFAYDSSYGNLKNIIDPNGFETISGWTKSTLTVDGFSYFVYVADSKTTDTNAAFTFKF